jgi:hypothetical protein
MGQKYKFSTKFFILKWFLTYFRSELIRNNQKFEKNEFYQIISELVRDLGAI